jgi:putative ABC transport system permease protein
MRALLQYLRFAFRQLRKTPSFTITVVLTLALGIGATTAVFSLVEGILLRPLPFQQPDRLVLLGDVLRAQGGPGVTAREIATYSAATTAFSSLGGYATAGYELSGGATPEQVNTGRFSAGVFSTLGVPPLLGRVFTQQEDDGHQPVAVISYALWLNRFHRDPQVLGNSIVLDRKAYSIIGVMPRDFEYPLVDGHLDQAQLWIPLNLSPEELSESQAGAWRYQIVGRLKEGVSLSQAVQDVDRVAKQAMRDFPPSMAAIQIHGDIKPLREDAVAGVRPLLRTLFFAVSIVLLLACLNVAGLLLVRAIRRRREYAVRLALGARSSVILRESVAEGLLLSVVSSVLGLAFAAAAIRATLHLLPESMPRIDSISIDGNVVTFALLLALATGALCSLAPAFAALRTNLIESLKEGAQTGSGAASHTWLRSALVVSEIAIAMVLLTVAGALLRSFQRMRAVDPGVQPDQVLVASYQLPLNQYSTYAAADRFNHAVVERLSNQPGMVAAGITSVIPSLSGFPLSTYTIEGQPEEGWKLKFAMFATTYGDYFHAMGIPLLDGRTFSEEDKAGAPLVVIVNQSMAKHSWPGERAVGKRMHVGNPKKGLPWATVVGVVADARLGGRDEPAVDQWYSPVQQPAIFNGVDASETLPNPASGYLALRSALPPEQIKQTLRSSVASFDPLLAIEQVQPMSEAISNVEAPRRFNTYLISAFAAGALLLAITGIYAVVAFSVSLRTQEIAIRLALGAPRAGITRLVVISGAKLALLGCGLGVLGSLAVSRLVSGFLFDVSATDPLIYGAGVVVMMLMALLASAFPATRAASADPIDALRST